MSRSENSAYLLSIWPRRDQWSEFTWLALNSRATDERTTAERRWRGESPKWAGPYGASRPKLAAKPQQPMDIGLFGDEHLQMDLIEMFMEPINGDD